MCKPFTGNFNKYGNFLGKINCFYLMSNNYLHKAKENFDKIESKPENIAKVEQFVKGNNPAGFELSGIT